MYLIILLIYVMCTHLHLYINFVFFYILSSYLHIHIMLICFMCTHMFYVYTFTLASCSSTYCQQTNNPPLAHSHYAHLCYVYKPNITLTLAPCFLINPCTLATCIHFMLFCIYMHVHLQYASVYIYI